MEKRTIYVKQIYLEDFEQLVNMFTGYFGKAKIYADGYEVYDLNDLYSRKLKRIRYFRITAINHTALLSIKSGIAKVILKDSDPSLSKEFLNELHSLISKYKTKITPSLITLDIILFIGTIISVLLSSSYPGNKIYDILQYVVFFLAAILFYLLKRRDSINLTKSGDKKW